MSIKRIKIYLILFVSMILVMTSSATAVGQPQDSSFTNDSYAVVTVGGDNGRQIAIPLPPTSENLKDTVKSTKVDIGFDWDNSNTSSGFTSGKSISAVVPNRLDYSKKINVYVISEKPYSTQSTGGNSVTKYPARISLWIDYSTREINRVKKIKVVRYRGKMTASYPTTFSRSNLYGRDTARGHQIRKRNVPRTFSYKTGWGYVDYRPGTGANGTYGILDTYMTPQGMATLPVSVAVYL